MDISTETKRGRGRPKGSKNRRVRGPAWHRPLPPLTPDEMFTLSEARHYVLHSIPLMEKLIRAGKFPKPKRLPDGRKTRVLTGAQIIAYKATIARDEEWIEPE